MTFDTPASGQSMFLVLAPVNAGITKSQMDAQLVALGNRSGPQMQAALDATGVIHFSSLATIESEKRIDLVWELTADGTQDSAIAALTEHCEALLRPIFAQCGLGSDDSFAAFLKSNIVDLHGKPWGANGLNYNGMGE